MAEQEIVKDLIDKMTKIKFARYHEDGEFITVDEKRKACDELGIPYELLGFSEKRPQRWSDEEAAEKLADLITGKGYITDERVINKNLSITVVSQTGKDTDEINDKIDEIVKDNPDITRTNVFSKTARLTLAVGVRAINGKSTGHELKDRIQFFLEKSSNLIDILIGEYREFNLDVNNLILEGDIKKK